MKWLCVGARMVRRVSYRSELRGGAADNRANRRRSGVGGGACDRYVSQCI